MHGTAVALRQFLSSECSHAFSTRSVSRLFTVALCNTVVEKMGTHGHLSTFRELHGFVAGAVMERKW